MSKVCSIVNIDTKNNLNIEDINNSKCINVSDEVCLHTISDVELSPREDIISCSEDISYKINSNNIYENIEVLGNVSTCEKKIKPKMCLVYLLTYVI